ncbi:hypothetical protein ES708_17301 [subsurface metagenome]
MCTRPEMVPDTISCPGGGIGLIHNGIANKRFPTPDATSAIASTIIAKFFFSISIF